MTTPSVGMHPLQLSPTSVTANADLAVFLVIGVLAGAHCLGLCGPLVGLYAARISNHQEKRRRDTLTTLEIRQHALSTAAGSSATPPAPSSGCSAGRSSLRPSSWRWLAGASGRPPA